MITKPQIQIKQMPFVKRVTYRKSNIPGFSLICLQYGPHFQSFIMVQASTSKILSPKRELPASQRSGLG
jgi:hypothetical protein